MLSFRGVPERAPAEPIRDYLIYAHWITTGRDNRMTAAQLGLTPILIARLAESWQWRYRLAAMPREQPASASPANATDPPGDPAGLTADTMALVGGRASTSGNDPALPTIRQLPGQLGKSNAYPLSQLRGTKATESHNPQGTHGILFYLLDHWPLAYVADLCNLRATTRAGYLADAARYLEWCEQDGLDPLAATRADVARYRDDLMRGQAMPTRRSASAATVQRRIAVVRHLYDWLALAGLVPACPARPLPLPVVDPYQAALRRPWVTGQQRRMVLDTVDELAAANRIPLRDRAILYLLAYGAPRVSEISGLTVGSLVDGNLTWSGKGGGRPRTIRLPAGVADAIAVYLTQRRRALINGTRLPASAPMFTTRHGRTVQSRQVRKIVARMCQFAGIPHRSPHAWRHGLITSARQAGMTREDVQAYIGHARGDTTARYEHLAPDRALDAGAWLWEIDHDRGPVR